MAVVTKVEKVALFPPKGTTAMGWQLNCFDAGGKLLYTPHFADEQLAVAEAKRLYGVDKFDANNVWVKK